MSSLFYDAFSTYSVFVLTYGTASLIGFALDYYSVYEDKKLKKRTRDEYIVLYKKCLPVVAKNVIIYSFPYIYTALSVQKVVWGHPQVYPDNINADKATGDKLEQYKSIGCIYNADIEIGYFNS